MTPEMVQLMRRRIEEAEHAKHDVSAEVVYCDGWAVIRRRCSCGKYDETVRQAADMAMLKIAGGSMAIRRMEIAK